MSNNYSINPASRGVNNFFESLTNSSNPQYITPIQSYQPPPQPLPTYTAPQPLTFAPTPTFTTYPAPTVTYTPENLRHMYVPLNSSFNDAYYGK